MLSKLSKNKLIFSKKYKKYLSIQNIFEPSLTNLKTIEVLKIDCPKSLIEKKIQFNHDNYSFIILNKYKHGFSYTYYSNYKKDEFDKLILNQELLFI